MQTLFRGIATALVTPMTPSGVDYAALEALIDWQIGQGVQGLVVCGTSGEASTLTDAERSRVVETAVRAAGRRVPVIAGTGSNNTAHAVALTRQAQQLGADGALVVTPYYNKATQAGLVAHFRAISQASDLPLIVYNVPGRTGQDILPETYGALADLDQVAGIKEASGNITKIARTAALVGDRLALYSGNDDQIVPILALGGQGCISVLSNVLPAETVRITDLWFAGDTAGAAALQAKYQRLIQLLFSQVNPIPVKAALAAMGRCADYLRLPLTPLDPAPRVELLAELEALGALGKNTASSANLL